MLVTPSGMIMEVKLDALLNALDPMLVICEPSANVTEVKLDAPWNTASPMLVTLAGMIMEVKLVA